jgi:hypothetical protein
VCSSESTCCYRSDFESEAVNTVRDRSMHSITAAANVRRTSASTDTSAAVGHSGTDHLKQPDTVRSTQSAPVAIDQDYARVGNVFDGSMVLLKNTSDPKCSNVIPPYVQITAQINGSDSYNMSGGLLYVNAALSYGNTDFNSTADTGAFAAMSQSAYKVDFYRDANNIGDTDCASNNFNVKLVPDSSVDVQYNASTTTTVELPEQCGIVCDSGNKIILRDSLLCYRTVLSRVKNTNDTAAARRLAATKRELQTAFTLLGIDRLLVNAMNNSQYNL